MSDRRPFDLGLSGTGQALVLLGAGQAASMAELARLAPELVAPAHANELALAVNHFAHGSDYRVITDPAAFEAAYRDRLAREDANAEWHEGVVRLRDFGIPDFGQITPPRLDGRRLTFFAADTYLGVPYRVEATDILAAPTYTPLPLTPVAPPSRAGASRMGRAITPEEERARGTVMPGDLPTR